MRGARDQVHAIARSQGDPSRSERRMASICSSVPATQRHETPASRIFTTPLRLEYLLGGGASTFGQAVDSAVFISPPDVGLIQSPSAEGRGSRRLCRTQVRRGRAWSVPQGGDEGAVVPQLSPPPTSGLLSRRRVELREGSQFPAEGRRSRCRQVLGAPPRCRAMSPWYRDAAPAKTCALRFGRVQRRNGDVAQHWVRVCAVQISRDY